MECSAFTNAPELLAALVFVESLGDNEALTVDGILPMEHRPQAGDEPSLSPYESSVALLDFKDHTFKPVVQFEDSSLLRELNKCLLAFRQNIDSRRPSPVGQSSSSSAGLDGGFQSLPSSINSSSQNSIYVTDSADQQSDDAGPENKEHKPPQQATTTLCHRAKKVVKADTEARPARQPTDENKTVKTVLDALKQATQVVTLKQSSTAEPAPAVMNATSLPPPSEKVPNCCQKTTVPELPVLRKSSRRSFNSSSSKGSFEERRRSYEKILSALPPPAAASPPLLTQAVLCAQRHPSPRPERRGSGATGQSGMVFRPVTPSPTGSRRSSFRPLLESMPVLDPRKESHELPCRGPIPLPDCTFSSLITKNICSTQPSTVPLYALLQEKHTLSSSPVSSPRFRSSFGYSEDEPDRPVSLDLPVSKASRPDVPENVDIPQSSPLTSPATNGGRGSLSGSSTPYGSPEAELWPRMYRQKTTEDEHDFRTAEESFSEGTDDRQHSPVRVKQRFLRTRRQRSFRAQTSGSSFQSSARLSRDDSASSAGFVLDYRSDDDDCGVSSLSKHERYEDFRRRIKRRTRRLARRASRGSRMSYSSGSSEMDDIYEDPELGFSPRMQRPIRAANSEPTLFSETRDSTRHEGFPPLSLASEVVITSSPGRRQMLMMTTRLGLPKAYSFDGVNPNLPVPFKAKFRCRKPADVDSDPECLGLTRHDADFIRNFALPPPSPEAVGTSSGKEDTDESRGQATGKPLSQAEEPAEAEQKDTTVCSEPSPLLKPSASGVRPVATCRWSRDGSGSADVQLEAIIQWLAASMARVPCFVVYTGGEPKLEQLPQVGYKAEERHWTVGDLACETLRYCRNRLAIQQGRYKGKMSRDTTLFSLLIGHTGKFQSHDSLD
uniref:Putative a-kinase anchor protein 110 kDa n=1 Tax=Ornithodoros turicata TaxID=34597 RepID=A0A2R5L3X6_9ACAR